MYHSHYRHVHQSSVGVAKYSNVFTPRVILYDTQ